jgi:hypothetical protein
MPLIGDNIHGEQAGLVHYPGPFQEVNLPKTKSAVIPKGALLFCDVDVSPAVWKVCGTSGTEQGPFAVAIKNAVNGDDTVQAVKSGAVVTVIASGDIEPGAIVQPSSDEEGEVEQWGAPDAAVVSDTVPSLNNIFLRAGRYLKLANSVPMGDGVTIPVKAEENDVIEIVLF